MHPAPRTAVRDDLAQIVEIYNSTIPSRMVTADTEPVSVESRLSWFKAHDPVARPLWVCARGNEIDAWLSFSDFYGRPAYRRTAEISVYVHASLRRQGLGRHLLAHAIAHAPRIDIDNLLGFIFAHNEPSLALFAQHGFDSWGRLPRVAILDGIERDLVIVGRRI
jgi:L-amino acid N-acyltransferase YncA